MSRGLGKSGHVVLAEVTEVKDNHQFTYLACKECFSKILLDVNKNKYCCLKCSREYSDQECDKLHRFRLSLCISDGSAHTDVTVFGRCVESFFGCSASGLHKHLQEIKPRISHVVDIYKVLGLAVEQVFIGQSFYFGIKSGICKTKNHASKSLPPLTISAIQELETGKGLVALQIVPVNKLAQHSNVAALLSEIVKHCHGDTSLDACQICCGSNTSSSTHVSSNCSTVVSSQQWEELYKAALSQTSKEHSVLINAANQNSIGENEGAENCTSTHDKDSISSRSASGDSFSIELPRTDSQQSGPHAPVATYNMSTIGVEFADIDFSKNMSLQDSSPSFVTNTSHMNTSSRMSNPPKSDFSTPRRKSAVRSSTSKKIQTPSTPGLDDVFSKYQHFSPLQYASRLEGCGNSLADFNTMGPLSREASSEGGSPILTKRMRVSSSPVVIQESLDVSNTQLGITSSAGFVQDFRLTAKRSVPNIRNSSSSSNVCQGTNNIPVNESIDADESDIHIPMANLLRNTKTLQFSPSVHAPMNVFAQKIPTTGISSEEKREPPEGTDAEGLAVLKAAEKEVWKKKLSFSKFSRLQKEFDKSPIAVVPQETIQDQIYPAGDFLASGLNATLERLSQKMRGISMMINNNKQRADARLSNKCTSGSDQNYNAPELKVTPKKVLFPTKLLPKNGEHFVTSVSPLGALKEEVDAPYSEGMTTFLQDVDQEDMLHSQSGSNIDGITVETGNEYGRACPKQNLTSILEKAKTGKDSYSKNDDNLNTQDDVFSEASCFPDCEYTVKHSATNVVAKASVGSISPETDATEKVDTSPQVSTFGSASLFETYGSADLFESSNGSLETSPCENTSHLLMCTPPAAQSNLTFRSRVTSLPRDSSTPNRKSVHFPMHLAVSENIPIIDIKMKYMPLQSPSEATPNRSCLRMAHTSTPSPLSALYLDVSPPRSASDNERARKTIGTKAKVRSVAKIKTTFDSLPSFNDTQDLFSPIGSPQVLLPTRPAHMESTPLAASTPDTASDSPGVVMGTPVLQQSSATKHNLRRGQRSVVGVSLVKARAQNRHKTRNKENTRPVAAESPADIPASQADMFPDSLTM